MENLGDNMETEVFKFLSVGGTPATIILGGYLFFRWTSSQFNLQKEEFNKNFAIFADDLKEIKQALDYKLPTERFIDYKEDAERRIERIENFVNGSVK
jgi:hypothetical protein